MKKQATILLQYYNKMHVINLEPLAKKWKSFGFNVLESNGHDIKDIKKKILLAKKSSKPPLIIFHTIKGRGIKSAENNRFWHHKSNLKKEELIKITEELNNQ